MDRQKVFERALLAKKVGGNGLIVIADTIYFISSPFFGMMEFQTLIRYILFMNMLVTCILFQNLIISRGDTSLELNTEKIVFYPTTRERFLLDKYLKTLILLIIQLLLTILCSIIGYYGNRSRMDSINIMGGLLAVVIGILLTSGISILVMHIFEFGIYLSLPVGMVLFFFTGIFQKLLNGQLLSGVALPAVIVLILFVTVLLWALLLWIGIRIYNKIC